MVKGTFEICRNVYNKDDYHIYAAIPLEITKGNVELNKYGNITIKSTSMSLTLKKRYILDLEEEVSTKYGMNYNVVGTGLDFKDVDDITSELNYQLLLEMTSENLANVIQEKYPNFVKLILTNHAEQIDIKQLRGVGNKLFNKYQTYIKKRCSAFILRSNFKNFNLTDNDCEILLALYQDIPTVKDKLNATPFDIMIRALGRSFFTLDKMIGMDYRYTNDRIEWMIDAFLRLEEMNGSTYYPAITLARKIMSYDKMIVSKLKDVAEESKIITYIEDDNTLQRTSTYEAEQNIARFFMESLSNNKPMNWEWQNFTQIKDGELTDEQKQALKMVTENNISVLIGYGGTGKTSSVKAILTMLEHYNMSYMLLAPTGKASMRISEQTGRDAYTIHKATMAVESKDEKIEADFVIIDEASMLSIDLVNMVLNNIYPDTRLLFIGDPAQIPSIGIGRFLKDVIESNQVPVCALTHCFRFEEGGASYVSTLSRNGELYLETEPTEPITLGHTADYTYIPFNGKLEQITGVYEQVLNDGYLPSDICLLVPYNKYQFGTINLNNKIQSLINPISENDITISITVNKQKITFHANDQVMNVQNNYRALRWEVLDNAEFDDDELVHDAKVFNGQTGRIIRIDAYNQKLESPIAIIDVEGEILVYTLEEISNLRLAYASTIHKYQGSEAKVAINVVIPDHLQMLNRQLLYTAQTRFKEKLIEIADYETVKYALSKQGDENRNTRLCYMLEKY